MNYRILIFIVFSLSLFSCELATKKNSKTLNFEIQNKYKNLGFALIYDDNLKNMIQYDLNILIIILITILGVSVYLLYNTIKKNIILASIIFLTTINMYVINNKILKRPDLIIESTNIENILDPLEQLKEK